MRHWLVPVLFAFVGILLPRSSCATTIDLSWNTCNGALTNAVPGPGQTNFSLYVTAIGQTEPHKGYEFWLTLGDAADTVPAAWRFDAVGCQDGGAMLSIDHLGPAACHKCCPTFQGAVASLQIKSFDFAPEHLGVPTTMAAIVLANVYPDGMTTVSPATRWHLARILFDHTLSVEGSGTPGETCGGYERNVCIAIHAPRANWLRMNDEQVPFEIGRGSVTFRGECKAVPAASSTWGQIKGQYRR